MPSSKTHLKNRPRGRKKGSRNRLQIPSDLSQVRMLPVREFAIVHGMSVDAVRRAIRAGKLEVERIGPRTTLVRLPGRS
jgi:hypothetical protein